MTIPSIAVPVGTILEIPWACSPGASASMLVGGIPTALTGTSGYQPVPIKAATSIALSTTQGTQTVTLPITNITITPTIINLTYLTSASGWSFPAANGARFDPATNGQSIGFIHSGVFASFPCPRGTVTLILFVASPYAGTILTINGISVVIPETGSWSTWEAITITVPVTGNTLSFTGSTKTPTASGYLFNILFPICVLKVA